MEGNNSIDPEEFDDEMDVFEDEFGEELYPYESNQGLESIESTMENFLAAAHVDAVYGEPIKQQDTLVIPAAEVISVAGFGLGYGSGESEKEGSGNGVGGGGGGRVFSRPVAVVIATPEGVRVEPVVDLTKIALAGITAFAFMISMASRFRKLQRTIEDIG